MNFRFPPLCIGFLVAALLAPSAHAVVLANYAYVTAASDSPAANLYALDSTWTGYIGMGSAAVVLGHVGTSPSAWPAPLLIPKI